MNKKIFLLLIIAISLTFFGCAERKAKENHKLAEELFKGGNYKEAAAKYAEVIKLDKDIPEVEDSYLKLGVIYAKYLEDPNSSVFYLEELIKKYPKSQRVLEARKEVGVTYLYKLNKADKALEQFEVIEKENPKVPYLDEIVFLKGKAYISLNKLDLASKTYENFSTIFPNSKYLEEVEYQKCFLKLNLGKNKEAIQYYENFLVKYPNSSYASLARYDLATAYENMGDLNKALDAYKSVGKDYPNQEALKVKIEKLEERLKKKSKKAITRTPKSVKESRKKPATVKSKKTTKTKSTTNKSRKKTDSQ